jgi:hypothetical protein
MILFFSKQVALIIVVFNAIAAASHYAVKLKKFVTDCIFKMFPYFSATIVRLTIVEKILIAYNVEACSPKYFSSLEFYCMRMILIKIN